MKRGSKLAGIILHNQLIPPNQGDIPGLLIIIVIIRSGSCGFERFFAQEAELYEQTQYRDDDPSGGPDHSRAIEECRDLAVAGGEQGGARADPCG